MKTLLEGKGCLGRSNLYGLYSRIYVGSAVFIATNQLPALPEMKYRDSFTNDIWKPMVARVNFAFTFKYEQIHTITHKEISVCLKFLCDNPEFATFINYSLKKTLPTYKDEMATIDDYTKRSKSNYIFLQRSAS